MANRAFVRIVRADKIRSRRRSWISCRCRPESERKKNASQDCQNRCTNPAKQLRPIRNHQQFFHKSLLLSGNKYPISAPVRSTEIPRGSGAQRSTSNQRATGIEPAWPAWKAGTLPLSYARADSAGPARAKMPRACKTAKRFFPRPDALDLSITEV